MHAFLWMTCMRVCVCAPPPSYCVPILSKRQKAHLDLVGWKVGLLHRALLVNSGLLVVLGPLASPFSGCPHVLPVSKCSTQQIFETLQVNHKTAPLLLHPHPQASASAFTNRKREWPKSIERHTNQRSWHKWLLSEQAASTLERLLLIINFVTTREQASASQGSERERQRDSALYRTFSRNWAVSQWDSRMRHLLHVEQITWISLRGTQSRDLLRIKTDHVHVLTGLNYEMELYRRTWN